MNNVSKTQLLSKIAERKQDIRRARWLLKLFDEKSMPPGKIPNFVLDELEPPGGIRRKIIKIYSYLLQFDLVDPRSLVQHSESKPRRVIVREDFTDKLASAKANAELIIRRSEEAIKKLEEELASRG